MKRKFLVTAIWDEEAHVFYSKSDIHGLHIEARHSMSSSPDCRSGADLIIENHLSSEEVNTTPLRDLIPSIVLREPAPIEGAA